jgi:DNA-binding MurR/RpiR family transcriptional regulator
MSTAEVPTGSRPIEVRITEKYADLAPQERRAADVLLEHLHDLAVYRASELADLAGVSKATMSRLFRRLDYDDFTQVRDQLLALRNAGLPVPVGAPPTVAHHLEVEVEHLRRVLVAAEGAVEEAAGLVAGAATVTTVGLRNSYPVALHLAQQLTQVRTGVRVAPTPGQSLSDEVVGLGPDDVLVVVAFRRRPPEVAGLLALARAQGTRVVLMADPSGRRLARPGDVWIECGAATQAAFDSHAAAMSVVAALSSRVLEALGSAAGQRVAAIAAAYRALDEVEVD